MANTELTKLVLNFQYIYYTFRHNFYHIKQIPISFDPTLPLSLYSTGI